MARHLVALVSCAALVLLPGRARPETAPGSTPTPPPAQETAPPTAAPSEAPPPAPSPPPPPPQAAPRSDVPAPPPGQWVYTQQYGWVWMPYADAYTYAPADGYGEPYMYVYYPVYGWTWIVAPWVWGWGPWPFFGPWGSWRFGWFAHGWWRSPDRFHFRQVPFRAPFPGPVIRPGASSASVPSRGAGPGVRPGASRGGHATRR